MSRLVVVSNRCTVPRRGSAPGGLAVALTSAIRESGGLWFGWNGSVNDTSPRRATRTTVDGIRYATLPLPRRDYEDYYKGFANSVLWPLFHYRVDAVQFEPRFREGYRRANEFFARKLVPEIGAGDVVWVHDYHLIPLGHGLRSAGVKSAIGFFLHIPFPPLDVLRTLPDYEDLLWAFCAYDVIGFQTDHDLQNFFDCIRRVTGAKVKKDGSISWGDRKSFGGVFPISIDPAEVRGMATSGREVKTVRRLKESLHARPLVIGVDRLDYSKGLPERFQAYERMLRNYPETVGDVTYLQVAQPSREDVPEYNELRIRLEGIVGEINGHFAEFDWVPLRYLNKAYARPTIMSFLALARVGLVTPLRDGMNLVAKEYIAAQDDADPGVLVLSELAGAARELDSVLLVNPYDVDAVADALVTALKMPLEERRERWFAAYRTIARHDVYDWARSFTARLRAPRAT